MVGYYASDGTTCVPVYIVTKGKGDFRGVWAFLDYEEARAWAATIEGDFFERTAV